MRIANTQGIIYLAKVYDRKKKIIAQKYYNSLLKMAKDKRYIIIEYIEVDISNNIEYLIGDMYG